MIKISKNTNKRTNKKIKRTVLGFIQTISNLKSTYSLKKKLNFPYLIQTELQKKQNFAV